VSRHLDKLDDLFARFDELEAETIRQAQAADDLLLSESDAPDRLCYTLPNGECVSSWCPLHGPINDTLTNHEETDGEEPAP
jgi:hypothetical protein